MFEQFSLFDKSVTSNWQNHKYCQLLPKFNIFKDERVDMDSGIVFLIKPQLSNSQLYSVLCMWKIPIQSCIFTIKKRLCVQLYNYFHTMFWGRRMPSLVWDNIIKKEWYELRNYYLRLHNLQEKYHFGCILTIKFLCTDCWN